MKREDQSGEPRGNFDLQRLRSRFGGSAWSLAHHYRWVGPVAVVWLAIVCILFVLPGPGGGQ